MLTNHGKRVTLLANATYHETVAVVAEWPCDAKSNCWLWAVQQFARDGGELIGVRSAFGNWLHWRWRRPDGRVFEFTPNEAKYRQEQPPTLFEGQVVELLTGDR